MALNIPNIAAPTATGDLIDAYNQLTTQALQRKKMELENKYYGPTAQANALSKIAYAKYAGPEAISKYLNIPGVINNLTPKQYEAVVQMGHEGLRNAPNINVPMPREEESIGEKLTNYFLEKLGINQKQQIPAYMMQQQSNNNLGNMPLPNRTINELQNIPQENAQPNNKLGYGIPAVQQAQGLKLPGTMGGMNPQVASDVEKKAAETAAIGQTQAANKQWEERQTNAAQAANDAATLTNWAKSFHSTYPKAFYTGARKGTLPSQGVLAPPTISEEGLSQEQTLDTLAGNMQAQVAKMLGGQKLTNQELTLAGNLKLGRHLEPGAEKDLFNSIEATANRIRTRQKFYNAIRHVDPSIDPNEADVLWDIYNVEYPPYDVNNFKALEKNNNKWKEFATKGAIKELRETGEYVPTGKKRIQVINPDGVRGTLPQSQIEKARQSGWKIINE